MPPSGVDGVMDEQAAIEAEIQLELENINVDDDVDFNDDAPDDFALEKVDDVPDVELPVEVDDYIKKLQDQSSRFEQELLECDELLIQSSRSVKEHNNSALILYEDHSLLMQLAKEHGCGVEEYKRKILEDIENDDVIIDDAELADLIDDSDPVENGAEQCSTDNVEIEPAFNGELSIKIEKAVEEGIDPDDVPISRDVVPVTDQPASRCKEMQRALREQLEKLELSYQKKIDKIKKDEAFKRDEEEVRERRMNEERHWKIEEIHQQEQQLAVEREMAEKEMHKKQEEAEKEMQENLKKFQEEMAVLQRETDRQKKELELAVEMERRKQMEKHNKAALDIQRTYRGYRVRRETRPILEEKKEQWKKEKEEQRIREIELEIERRKEEQLKQDELERQRQEEDKKQKEELKRQKEEEKKRLEEEKRKKKEEEERIKQEEKRKKEEEKQRKKEEEKRRKEEEKRLKEEEEQKKKEEKRLKEEEERRKKEEEKRLKEEEKKKKEEEKIRKEEEEKRKKEEERLKLEEEKRMKEEEKRSNEEMEKMLKEEEKKARREQQEEKGRKIKEEEIKLKDGKGKTQALEEDSKTKDKKNKTMKNELYNNGQTSDSDVVPSEHNLVKTGSEVNTDRRPKTPRSSRSSGTPRPSASKKENKKLNKEEEVDKGQKERKHDSLPEHIDALRLKFMKECLPWSKIGNDPWKLKAGISKKPPRRPSSAKKLALLSEDVILQAARVASLKMVTTVELKDLPGNNISTLGQCGGLKYLTLTRCNLVIVEGLSQCKQLQYINLQNNSIEYVDLKNIGQLTVLNLSHNKLSSVHGLDNCTNLRWLDLSHNNITRLGGMETLRRLHTLKLSHNQLITTQGLGDTPTLQIVDVSHNHLQAVEDIEKLCLLLSLDASSNNLLNIPSLHNQVLLLELLLSDNSISSLSVLASVWLPILGTVCLDQNSISELPSLQNCLLLKDLNLIENQISSLESVSRCVEQSYYLEHLNLADNPVVTDITTSFRTKLKCSCPRLQVVASSQEGTVQNSTPVKPRNSFEAMSLTQLRGLRDIIGHFQHSIKNTEAGSQATDQAQVCDNCSKFCERTFNIAVEYRYAHEYGDVSITFPSAPTAPKSGRPLSSRQREKFLNPKEMFENALKGSQNDAKQEVLVSTPGNYKDLFNNAVSQGESKNNHMSGGYSKGSDGAQLGLEPPSRQESYSSQKDLFEQSLKSAGQPKHGEHQNLPSAPQNAGKLTDVHSAGGHGKTNSEAVRVKAATTIQAYYRGWHVRHEISEHTKMWLAATTIQAAWRGYWCRKHLQVRNNRHHHHTGWMKYDPAELEHLNKSAVIIQAHWRGYILRKKLMAALEYAQCDFGDDDEDALGLGDEFDFDKFMDIDQDLLDADWKPPATPDLPNSYPVLKKPPSGKPRVPPLNPADLRPPSNPRRAWRNLESPLSDMGKIPRPPSSVASTELTLRSGVSRKEEKLAEEWGFKDTNTAHLMMQRAKKMKYNAERRKKISKLDPKQRLALFRKLQEVTHPMTHDVPQRKTLPRKEYFQARQDEIERQDHEKKQEFHVRVSRTFEWLHTQVGSHVVSDSVINQGTTEGPRYISAGENLPELLNGGKRVQLVSSPMSVELQSVESASTVGQKPRRSSIGSGSIGSKLPPIQPSSAPAPKVKERMSFRNPKVNQSVGWGGGKKRSGQK